MLVSALVDEVVDTFRSYVRQQEPTTSLSMSIDADDVAFTVADGNQLGRGLAQIEDEMVYVSTVDRTTGAVSLESWGRAQSGSTAASHASGARITQSPLAPRSRVRDLVSQVLQEVFPQLFAVSSTTLDMNAAQLNYALPADVYQVLTVEFQPPGPSLSWIPVRRWRQNRTPTTVELEILSWTQPGTDTVRVFYQKNPPGALTMSDDLVTLGFPESIRDIIVLGVMARLLAFTESSRVQITAAESSARAEAVPAGSATSASRYFYQLFVARVSAESMNLQMRYPINTHFTR